MSDFGDTEIKKSAQQFLGFDFGLKRIGVAVGQTLTNEARPLLTLAAKDGEPDWREIKTLLEDWNPTALVVGLPYNIDGSNQPLTESADRFAKQLIEHFDLPVHYVDERLSSREAQDRLRNARQSGQARRKAAHKLDAIAASVILESWLRIQDQET